MQQIVDCVRGILDNSGMRLIHLCFKGLRIRGDKTGYKKQQYIDEREGFQYLAVVVKAVVHYKGRVEVTLEIQGRRKEGDR